MTTSERRSERSEGAARWKAASSAWRISGEGMLSGAVRLLRYASAFCLLRLLMYSATSSEAPGGIM
jgi:hypothetical protein